jgi:hypothetical protein
MYPLVVIMYYRFLASSWLAPPPSTTLAFMVLVSLANTTLKMFSDRLLTVFPTPDRLLPTTAMLSATKSVHTPISTQ